MPPGRQRWRWRSVSCARTGPVGRQAGEVIAWVDGVPVALKRRGGRGGTLIFLGSPLGPALWAGDAQARRWLVDVLGLDQPCSCANGGVAWDASAAGPLGVVPVAAPASVR